MTDRDSSDESSADLVRRLVLHDRRRRRHTKSSAAAAMVLLASGAFAYLIAREVPARAIDLWLVVLSGSIALATASSAFRLFWSDDARALARLPTPGRALLRIGARRNARASMWLFAPAAFALGGLAIAGDLLAARAAAVLLFSFAATCGFAAACALAAGAVAASERALALAGSVSGEFRAPKGAALAFIPGVAGAGLVVAVLTGKSWLLSASPPWWPAAAAALALAGGAAYMLALARADDVMPSAMRELAALNRGQLAHVEQTRLTALEGALVWLLPNRWRPFVDKDLRLLRRRYPAFALILAAAVIGAWATAFWSPAGSARVWVIVLAMHAYSVVMTSRTCISPIEIRARWLFAPLSPAERVWIKATPGLLRTLVISLLVAGSTSVIDVRDINLHLIIGSSAFAVVAHVIVARVRS